MSYPPQGTARRGSTGSLGSKGDSGELGPKGERGSQGSRGLQGVKGEAGATPDLSRLLEGLSTLTEEQIHAIQAIGTLANKIGELNSLLRSKVAAEAQQRELEKKALDALNKYLNQELR